MAFEVQDDDVDELVTLLKATTDIRSVSDEAGDLVPPAVWVQTLGYTFNNAKKGAYTLNARLVLVVDDQNPRRARKALQALLNKVLAVAAPTGEVTARTVLIPGGDPALLPGLTFPLSVHITPEE